MYMSTTAGLTVLTTLSMESGTYAPTIPGFDPPKRTTHPVAYDPDTDRVIVRDVELFETMDDGALGAVDEDRLAKIAAATNARMDRGAYPQLITTHSKDAQVVGRIPSRVRVATHATTGAVTLFGDYEMTPWEFDNYIRSGKWPRRSVEIDPETLEIVQVSLLGRDQPAIPLRDIIMFGAAESNDYRRMTTAQSRTERGEVTSAAFTRVNGKASAIVAQPLPELSCTTGADDMPQPTNAAELLALIGALPETEQAKFAAEYAKAKKHSEDEDEDDEDKDKAEYEEDDKDRADMGREIAVARFEVEKARREKAERDLAEFRKAVDGDLTELKWRPRVESLRADGYKVNVDDEMNRLRAFSSDEQRQQHIDYIKAHFAREITGPSIIRNGMLPTAAFEKVSDNGKKAIGGKEDLAKIRTHAVNNNLSFQAAAEALNFTV